MDNQNQQEKRKKGVVDYINDSRQTLSSIKRASSSLRAINVALKTVGQIVTKPFPWVWIVVIIILLIVIFQLFFGGGTGLSFDPDSQDPNPPGAPGSQTTPGLNYYIPFRDSSVVPQNIRNEILSSWPNAQIGNWNIIVSESVAHGWNPAFLLALWIEESGAQGVPAADPLGCLAPSNIGMNDINLSLQCVFGSFGSLTNDRFADFMCRYSDGHDAPCTFAQNPNFPPNIRRWYSRLVPTGPGALVDVPPTALDPLTATCPIAGGTASTVTCGSFFTLRSGCGHCRADAGYANYMRNCNYEAINYAEDIDGAAGQDVFLPSINGRTIDWALINITPSSIGSIRYYSGVNTQTNEEYWIQFHHVDGGYGITRGISGNVGGRICITQSSCSHVHVEFSIVTPGGGRIPQDAPLFLCI